MAFAPEDAESYYFVAGVYHTGALIQPNHAFQHRAALFYQQAVGMDPAYHWALAGLAHLYFLNGQYGEADEAIARAITLENGRKPLFARGPQPTGFLTLRGLLQLRTGDLTAAEETFREALEKYEGQPHLWAPHFTVLAHCGLARVYERMEEWARALRAYRVARSVVGQHRGRLGMGHNAVRVHLGAAVAHTRLNENAEAAQEAAIAADYLQHRRLDFGWVWLGCFAETHYEFARYYAAVRQTGAALESLAQAVRWGWSAPDAITTELGPALDGDALQEVLGMLVERTSLPGFAPTYSAQAT